MLAKLKSNANSSTSEHSNLYLSIDSNPVANYYDIGKIIGTAGPELAWKLYEAHSKSDQKVKNFFKQAFY